jgi:predicted dehydrogenase
MNEHGRLVERALSAGKNVLVEKPMATTLEEAAALVAQSKVSARRLVCAPHIVLSPTYREVHRRAHGGVIGRIVLARARYGWSGPWWAKWYYEPGGGALFDLGLYNITSLCGIFGPVKRVTALVGTALPERIVEGEPIHVTSDDNAHVLLDFGASRFGCVTTGFTMQKYRSPAVELYGTDGVLQLLGDDWAPEGFEQWRNPHGAWEIFPESDTNWPWTDGLRHLVDAIESGDETVTKPEHAYHTLEVALAAMRSATEGRAIEVKSDFPALDYALLPPPEDAERRVHDPRTLV